MAYTGKDRTARIEASVWRGLGIWHQRTASENRDVNSYTAESALQLAPVTAAVSVIARAAAASEVMVERRTAGGYWERVTDNLPRWLDPECCQPNPFQSTYEWLWLKACSLLVGGNSIDVVLSRRNGVGSGEWAGLPDHIASVPFWYVSVDINGRKISPSDSLPEKWIPGYSGQSELTYWIDDQQNMKPVSSYDRTNPNRRVLHTRLLTLQDVVFGYSPLMWAAPAMRTALAADAYAEQSLIQPWPPGMFFNRGKVSEEYSQRATEYFADLRKNPERAADPLIGSGDWSFVSSYIHPDQMQLLATRQFSYDQAAALYGVPQALMSAPDTPVQGAGIRALQRGFTQGTVLPFLRLIAQGLSWMVPPGHRVRLRPQHLLEADPLEESRILDRYLRVGVVKRSEVRQELGLPPIDGIDDEDWPGLGPGDEGGDSPSGKDDGTEDELPTGVEGGRMVNVPYDGRKGI